MKEQGQSIVEVVFSIGVVALVVTGIVSLLIGTVGSRTKSYDRKKAVELSQIVMEKIVEEKNTDPATFWNLNSAYWVGLGSSLVEPNYEGYIYTAKGTAYSSNGCSNSVTECVNVVINIIWKDNRKVE